jgi:hypothetical protein
MMVEKIFCFTKSLEKTLENLLKMDNVSKDKKMQTEHNLNLLSHFNKMEIKDNRHEFKY